MTQAGVQLGPFCLLMVPVPGWVLQFQPIVQNQPLLFDLEDVLLGGGQYLHILTLH